MLPDEIWKEVTKWLMKERTISLPRGRDFRAWFDAGNHSVMVVPTETGIPRRIGKDEWIRFGEKYNKVIENGYDPLRPGHYAQITLNSSYLVAILREFGYSE